MHFIPRTSSIIDKRKTAGRQGQSLPNLCRQQGRYGHDACQQHMQKGGIAEVELLQRRMSQTQPQGSNCPIGTHQPGNTGHAGSGAAADQPKNNNILALLTSNRLFWS
eukprot:1157595-Pelagomonas_calceolata.AAC.10